MLSLTSSLGGIDLNYVHWKWQKKSSLMQEPLHFLFIYS